MKALSIKQPWADLIMFGKKDVENRTWSTEHRGPLLIHAGKRMDPAGADLYPVETAQCLRANRMGVILGSVYLYDCTGTPRSNWHEPGMIGWYMASPVPLHMPVLWPGQLSLFEIDVRRTVPPVRLCEDCSANLTIPGCYVCACCLWHRSNFSDKCRDHPTQEIRLYLDHLNEKRDNARESEK